MELTFWGVRGSCPVARPHVRRYGGNTACLQVRSQGRNLIIDAGTGIRKLGRALLEDPKNAHESLFLLISHPHWDHIQGFPHFRPAYLEQYSIEIYALRRPDLRFRELLKGQQDSSFFSVPLEQLASNLAFFEMEDHETRQIGPFTVTDARLNHPGISCGYRVEADGSTLAYICDVAPSRDLLLAEGLGQGRESTWLKRLYENQLSLAEGADVVIYDTFFTPEWYMQRKHWGHSTLEDGVEVCRNASARNLFMFHHNPERTDEELTVMVDEYQRTYDDDRLSIQVACEGDTWELSRGGVMRRCG